MTSAARVCANNCLPASERAHISNRRVRDLADRIIEAQRKEIGEVKALIEDLEAKR